ncbi:hypothetical protein EV645_8126 [Kribbella rubisoli]|uniref:Uncharacterized protein n=1 Tax=Kribbella rubisoli TaxID=3075929 RepID=A0A4V2FUB0_9ACTN|nr:hypothetical protein [Kribbella rubisoli]RZU01296.1 hypothetical protein EV645_8126 [Kribbella rubisoli]
MSDDNGPKTPEQEAKARGEAAKRALRAQKRRSLLRLGRDGTFVTRKGLKKRPGQVVIPKDAYNRWADNRNDVLEIPIFVLDFGWAVLVVPTTEADRFIEDLKIDHSRLKPPRHGR